MNRKNRYIEVHLGFGTQCREGENLKVIQARLAFTEALNQFGLDYIVIKANGPFLDTLELMKMA
jgi:hypothetical protein